MWVDRVGGGLVKAGKDNRGVLCPAQENVTYTTAAGIMVGRNWALAMGPTGPSIQRLLHDLPTYGQRES